MSNEKKNNPPLVFVRHVSFFFFRDREKKMTSAAHDVLVGLSCLPRSSFSLPLCQRILGQISKVVADLGFSVHGNNKNRKCRIIQDTARVVHALTQARIISRAFLWNVSVFSFELEKVLDTLHDIFFTLNCVTGSPFYFFHFNEEITHAVNILEDMKFFAPQQRRHITWDDGPVSI